MLGCTRTPGGHRKFRPRDIADFQTKRHFEATGLLSSDEWDDPEVEMAVHQKKFDWLTREVLQLALRNETMDIRRILERLHIRGLTFGQLYDRIAFPVLSLAAQRCASNSDASRGHLRLIETNLDEALYYLMPRSIAHADNGRLVLCASVLRWCRLQVNAISRTMSGEGWNTLNLGDNTPYSLLTGLIRKEPIDLICLATNARGLKATLAYNTLYRAARSYKIPVFVCGMGFRGEAPPAIPPRTRFVSDCCTLIGEAARIASK